MNIIYDFIFIIFSIFYIPAFLLKNRKRKGIGLRLGLYPKELADRLKERKNMWVHAVSVGEVTAISCLLNNLRNHYPDRRLVITTVTETGNNVAKRLAKGDEIVLFLPFDVTFMVRKVMSSINPSMLIIAETELWPNLIREGGNINVPVILVNGRISERSFKGYRLIRFMLKPILKKISLFIMQSETDKARIVSLGADVHKVRVSGNMKFDTAMSLNLSESERKEVSAHLGLRKEEKLLIAGSTHPQEEEFIVACYANLINRFNYLRLLIAPRHIERTPEIEKIILKHGFTPIRISQPSVSAQSAGNPAGCGIFILDTIGQLKNFYSIADMVFVGGSLIKKGGQNMIEPAVFAKPILFGPYTFNFRDVVSALLNNKAAIVVKDRKSFERKAALLLEDASLCREMGQRAKAIVEANRGATDITLSAISDLCR